MTPPARPAPPDRAWTAADAVLAILVAHAALFLGGGAVLAAGGWSPNDVPVAGTLASLVPFWAVALVAADRITRRGGRGPVAELGLVPRLSDLVVGTFVGVAAQLAVLPVLYLPLYDLLGTDRREVEEAARQVVDSARGPGGAVALVLLTCVGAPLVEEVLYRGLLMGALARHGPWVALGVTSVVFAAVHFQPLQFAGLLVFGLLAGALALRTGRLAPAVVAHVAFNATTLVMLWNHR